MPLSHESKGLVRSTVLVFSLRIVGALTTFLFGVLVARWFGAGITGLYFLGLALVQILAVVGRLGLDQALLRLLAGHFAARDVERLAESVNRAVLTAFAGLALISLPLVLAHDLIAVRIFGKPEFGPILKAMGLCIVPLGLLNVFAELLKSAGRLITSQFIQVFLAPAVSLGALFLGWRAELLDTPETAYAIGVVAACVAGLVIWSSVAMTIPAPALGAVRAGSLLDVGIPLMWVGALSLGLTLVDTIVLGIFRSAEEVGAYAIASKLAMLTSLILVASRSVTSPRFAAEYRKGNLDALASIATRSARFTTLASLPILLVFTVSPGVVLSLFGPEFVQGSAVLVILSLAQLVNVAAGPVAQVLAMTAHHVELRNVTILSSAITLAALLALVPQTGGIGAALSVALGVVVLNLLCTIFVQNRLNISVHCFASVRGSDRIVLQPFPGARDLPRPD